MDAGHQIEVGEALIVDEPWIARILDGKKTWELRTSHCRKRGWIGLIRKGSGQVVGVARIIGSVGPMTTAQLQAAYSRHTVPANELESGKYRYAWELADATALRRPVRYQHPNGAVKWVKLSPNVAQQITEQCASVGAPRRGVPPMLAG